MLFQNNFDAIYDLIIERIVFLCFFGRSYGYCSLFMIMLCGIMRISFLQKLEKAVSSVFTVDLDEAIIIPLI